MGKMKHVATGAAALFALCGMHERAEAQPPGDAPFGCLFEGIAGEPRARASAAAARRLTDMPADGERSGGVALGAILARLLGCGETGRWNAAQREMAERYALSQLAREFLLRHYAAQGIDLRVLDVVASPDALAGRPIPPFEELERRLRAQGLGDNRTDSAGDVTFIYISLARQAKEMKAHFNDPEWHRR